MKIAFNILPVITEYEQVHLLVEAGRYGISFLWFTKDPMNASGLAVYNLTSNFLPGEVADELEKILHTTPIFNKPYASVTISYDYKESLLVPESYFDPATAEAMLNLIYATDVESSYKTQSIKGIRIFNVYAVNKKIEAVFSAHFPGATYHHSTSLQLEYIQADDQCLHCIFFHNSIKVFMFNGTALQIVQQFSYNLPADAAYHLLNCCEQHNIKPAEARLILGGMIDEKSKLYAELYRYFLNIEFEKPQNGISLHDRIKFYPPHFFSHLTGLALCVS